MRTYFQKRINQIGQMECFKLKQLAIQNHRGMF